MVHWSDTGRQLRDRLQHHHPPAGPWCRSETGHHILLKSREEETQDTIFSNHHAAYGFYLRKVLHHGAPLRIWMSDNVPVPVDNRRVAFRAKAHGTLEFDEVLGLQCPEGITLVAKGLP